MSEILISTTYKDYTIKWDDFSRCFLISLSNIEVKKVSTLEDCQKWIDQKYKTKYQRVPVLIPKKWCSSNYVEGEATSVVDADDVWVVSVDGERSKLAAKGVWLLTDRNKEILAIIQQKSAEIERLATEIRDLQNSTDRLTISMLEVSP